MKIKISQAVLASQTCLSFKKEKMPLKTAYKLNRLINVLEGEVAFYNAKLEEAIKKYAETDEDGNPIFLDEMTIKIQESKAEQCQAEVYELENLEIEVEDIIFDLDELSHLSISVEEAESLTPFIKE